jgi:multidrug efflux pump
VGGLLCSHLLTLFITPVVYTYLEAFREWLGRRRVSATVTAIARRVTYPS